MIRDERRKTQIAICKDAMMMHVNTRQLNTRCACIHFVIGMLHDAQIDSIPINLLEDIDKLFNDGVLIA